MLGSASLIECRILLTSTSNSPEDSTFLLPFSFHFQKLLYVFERERERGKILLEQDSCSRKKPSILSKRMSHTGCGLKKRLGASRGWHVCLLLLPLACPPAQPVRHRRTCGSNFWVKRRRFKSFFSLVSHCDLLLDITSRFSHCCSSRLDSENCLLPGSFSICLCCVNYFPFPLSSSDYVMQFYYRYFAAAFFPFPLPHTLPVTEWLWT